MGTNFYTVSDSKHIGKRSAAGKYCWDCKVTLCKGGDKFIHQGSDLFSGFFDHCPKCGRKPVEEPMEESASGRELGFNKSIPKAKTGVKSCSSFTWAMKSSAVLNRQLFKSVYGSVLLGSKIIEDEYHQKYTLDEFYKVLEECPIQYEDMVGEEFS